MMGCTGLHHGWTTVTVVTMKEMGQTIIWLYHVVYPVKGAQNPPKKVEIQIEDFVVQTFVGTSSQEMENVVGLYGWVMEPNNHPEKKWFLREIE